MVNSLCFEQKLYTLAIFLEKYYLKCKKTDRDKKEVPQKLLNALLSIKMNNVMQLHTLYNE